MTYTEFSMLILFVVIGLLLPLYQYILIRYIATKWHLVIRSITGLSVVAMATSFGFSFADMGVQMGNAKTTLLGVATLCLLALSVLYGIIRLPIKEFFLATEFSSMTRKKVWFEAGLRVPIGTALFEEIIFRGVLLGALLTVSSVPVAIGLSALCFGLWHIPGEILAGHSRSTILLAIGATTLAGIGFGVLRVWTDSIALCWILHWLINASGIIGARVASRRASVARNT